MAHYQTTEIVNDKPQEPRSGIDALSPRRAAEEFAYRAWEAACCEGTERIVEVIADDGEVTRWRVVGEPIMEFHAERLDPETIAVPD